MECLLLVVLLVVQSGNVETSCPHQEQLQKFSEISANYDTSSVVVISERILLDVKVVDVEKIIVEGNGRLVFNRGHSITIKTKGILVRGDATLVIGSQTCPHEDDVNIYLKGVRTKDRDSLGPEGDKFIMVTDNGSLQIFGQDKLAWTKLTKTVDNFDKKVTNVKFRHLTSDLADYRNVSVGLAVSVFNAFMERKVYEIFTYMQSNIFGANKNIRQTFEVLNGLMEGDIVTLSIQNKYEVKDGCDIEDLYEKLEQLAGIPTNQLSLRDAGTFDAWAMVFVVNGNTTYNQALTRQIGTKIPKAVASVDYKGYKVSAVSAVQWLNKDRSYVDVLIIDPSVGYPEITVVDDVTSWNVGDKVLLTSTDFSWKHAEVRQIKQKIGRHTLKLDGELYYRHFGEIENRVDMRGEVALLTRNIKIQGVMAYKCPKENGNFCNIGFDSYGGHIKVHESFGSVHIEGAELEFMGQTSDRGFYPIHFHMCKNITGKTAIIRRNSIHNTFRRAVTIHGTYGTSETALGVQVIENVAYDILGHAYFLEDGAEMATLFQKNLGASVKNVVNDFLTDRSKVTVFWITNPKVIMVDNVAAGSEAVGIWYTFPREPVGLSKGLVFAFKETKHTKLWRFDNNVVHSNAKNGMFFDNILDNDDGKVVGCMEYSPREDPLDPESAPAKSQLTRLTAYKNANVNTWLRGGYFEVIQYSSAESKRGMHIARGSEQQMFVRKSVFIGRSVGNTEDNDYPDGLTGKRLGQYIGAVIHDGPTYYDSCWFDGFKPGHNDSYVAGAIGFSTQNKFTSSVASNLTDMRFGFSDMVDGNRIFDGKVDQSVEGFAVFDSAETATIRDSDGSVTGCLSGTGPQWKFPTQLVVPEKFALTERCSYRKNWNLAACNDKYGKLKVGIKSVWKGSADKFDNAGQLKRISTLNANDTAVEDRITQKTTEYMVILGRQEYYYQFQFTNDFPKTFRLYGSGVERDYGVVVGWCMPEGAVYRKDYIVSTKDTNHMFNGEIQIKVVSTLDEVIADKFMDKMYIEGRFVYMKLYSNRPRDGAWDHHDTDHCAGRSCPHFAIYMRNKMEFEPCFTPTKDEVSIKSSLSSHTCDLPPSAPDTDWGAGDTLAADQDGNWGQWSSWADCCYKEGETVTTTRYRMCDNPPKYGFGADCVGPSEESGQCQTPCPVNGFNSNWSAWSDCFCDGIASGTYGMRTRQKTCMDKANGGKGCHGPFMDSKSCIGDCGYFPVLV